MTPNLRRLSLLRYLKLQANRFLVSQSIPDATVGEQKLYEVLKNNFPTATKISVVDISGGCGAMYEISIQAEEFSGKSRVMQHRMVNEALKEEIKEMHGLRISTSTPA